MKYQDYRTLGFTTLQNGLIAYYHDLKVSDAEFVLLIQLEAFAQRGEHFPANDQLAANTNFTSNEIAELIQRLIDRQQLVIKQVTDQSGRISDRYDLSPLYEQLDHYLSEHLRSQPELSDGTTSKSTSLDNDPLNKLLRQFEMEFGRFMSPIEREEIQSWLVVDRYQADIIVLALREAVLSQAYSLKYVDRVLLNWQRHNLKTVAEVEHFLRRNQ